MGSIAQILAENIRELRRVRGLTQMKAAAAAEVDYKHYQRLESGTWPGLRTETIERLARVFGVEPWELIKPSGKPSRK